MNTMTAEQCPYQPPTPNLTGRLISNLLEGDVGAIGAFVVDSYEDSSDSMQAIIEFDTDTMDVNQIKWLIAQRQRIGRITRVVRGTLLDYANERLAESVSAASSWSDFTASPEVLSEAYFLPQVRYPTECRDLIVVGASLQNTARKTVVSEIESEHQGFTEAYSALVLHRSYAHAKINRSLNIHFPELKEKREKLRERARESGMSPQEINAEELTFVRQETGLKIPAIILKMDDNLLLDDEVKMSNLESATPFVDNAHAMTRLIIGRAVLRWLNGTPKENLAKALLQNDLPHMSVFTSFVGTANVFNDTKGTYPNSYNSTDVLLDIVTRLADVAYTDEQDGLAVPLPITTPGLCPAQHPAKRGIVEVSAQSMHDLGGLPRFSEPVRLSEVTLSGMVLAAAKTGGILHPDSEVIPDMMDAHINT